MLLSVINKYYSFSLLRLSRSRSPPPSLSLLSYPDAMGVGRLSVRPTMPPSWASARPSKIIAAGIRTPSKAAAGESCRPGGPGARPRPSGGNERRWRFLGRFARATSGGGDLLEAGICRGDLRQRKRHGCRRQRAEAATSTFARRGEETWIVGCPFFTVLVGPIF